MVAIMALASPAQAGNKDDTLKIASQVEIPNVDKDDMTHDQEIAGWFKTGDNSLDPQVRLANYAKSYEKIADQVYWLPMYTINMNYVYNKDLEFKPTPDELPQFYNTRWK